MVCKFGGTSVACKESIEKIKTIIKNKNRNIIVLSALGKRFAADKKITDILIDIYNNFVLEKNTNQGFNILCQRFFEVTTELNVKINIKNQINKIKTIFLKNKNPDYLISRGEYLTAQIIAKYLNIKFVDAEKLMFFDNFLPNYCKINKKINYYLKKYKKIIIPGFYGVQNNGIFLFERGGSDLTGAIIARATNNKIYEIWTDVCGVYNINPNMCSDYSVIKKLSYNDLLTMSAYDATVVQSECVKVLKDTSVVLKVKNTFKPKNKGTIISKAKTYNSFICFCKQAKESIVLLHSKNLNQKLNSNNFKILELGCNNAILKTQTQNLKQTINQLKLFLN